MTKKELLEELEELKQQKTLLEKKLPKNFKRTSPIYQYGINQAYIWMIEDKLTKFENQ